jgi:L-threonylcarbamoyladenylate synthase
VKTLRLVVEPDNLESAKARAAIGRAAAILRAGGLVALPTETVYGLGANALNVEAVERIFAVKRRPAWDPMIVHIADGAMLEELVTEIPDAARRLMAAFWPGPLTLLLKKTAAVPDAVTAGRPLVGVRMPAHPVALELIRRTGVPVAAPSANIFGRISPTTAAHVLADLDGRIDAVLDAGPTEHGVESTVLDPCQSPIRIYRPGAVTVEQIRAVAGAVEAFQGDQPQPETISEAQPSPELEARLAEEALRWPGERVGVMLPTEVPFSMMGAISHLWGSWTKPEELARELYAGLRALDAAGCTVILCPLPPVDGIGAAIRDRLIKAGDRN